MKILALEREVPGVSDVACAPHLKAEAMRAWELVQASLVREIYFRTDWPGAVIMLECLDVEEARSILGTLPLVQQGLITFELVPLGPYPGFARLFADVTPQADA
jgi:hypothetical protein